MKLMDEVLLGSCRSDNVDDITLIDILRPTVRVCVVGALGVLGDALSHIDAESILGISLLVSVDSRFQSCTVLHGEYPISGGRMADGMLRLKLVGSFHFILCGSAVIRI